MKRALASLLLVTQMGLLAGPALAVQHGEATGHRSCHQLAAPGNELAVEGPVESTRCPMDDCASRSSCTGVTTAMIASESLSFLEEIVSADRLNTISHEVSAALISDQPPPRV